MVRPPSLCLKNPLNSWCELPLTRHTRKPKPLIPRPETGATVKCLCALKMTVELFLNTYAIRAMF